MIALLLWALTTIDTACTGYREAAGRNAQLDKSAYYRHAMIRGALLGQVVVIIVGGLTLFLLVLLPQPVALFEDLHRVGVRMTIVYVPYALVVLLAIAVRAVPSVDLRSITSVLIFGPFTLIRPIVVLAGLLWGVLSSTKVSSIALGVLGVSAVLSMEWIMGQLRKRGAIS